MEGFEQAVEQYHQALREVAKGNPEPVLRMFSGRPDVLLCNPFRPFARGPDEVAEATREAAARFHEGEITFSIVARHGGSDLGYIVETEDFTGWLDGGGSGSLRVTTIFRSEDDEWKVAHRHADAVTTPKSPESVLAK